MEQVIFYFSFKLDYHIFSGKAVIIEDYGTKEFRFFDKRNERCSVSVVSDCDRLSGIYIPDEEYEYGFLLEVGCFDPVECRYLINKTEVKKLLAKDIASRIGFSEISPEEIEFMYGNFYHNNNNNNKFEEIIL